MYLSISAAATYLGVSISTLRRWHQEESLQPDYRTVGGHRRYSISGLRHFCADNRQVDASTQEKKTVLYSRVSSSDQKEDLSRQTDRLESDTREQNLTNTQIIEDLGSGINYKKPGLRKLLKMLLSEQVERLVIHHKDRLLRFGSELVFTIWGYLKIEVVILEESLGSTFEQELASDVIEIMTVFSSRLYGRRAHLNRAKEQRAA